ncbi:TadE-like protein [Paenibacillus macerans]|uniref:TadE-like family protein n=1 Tax=Paenibacillus macerans TaxID=44252 RepID=A0A090Z908_PAEMA|nr:tadE-like family protein [Paenibacillus macerans]MBS5912341.1 pilus assembly protein [Paenibacillus macerans]SUA85085.1 TadE-like protein [Paenibacillus macerans]
MPRNKRTSHIDERQVAGRKSGLARGSIVLEAALVMPVFVMVLFWFIYMVHMTLLSSQLNTVASNAVRQVSAHIYPVALAVSAGSGESAGNAGGEDESPGEGSSFNWKMPSLSVSEWAKQYAGVLPEPISDWVMDAAEKGDEPLQHIKTGVAESVLDPAVKPLLLPFLEGTLLTEKRLHVSRVTVPDLKTGKRPYFGLEISYELPIKVPFTSNRVVLQSRAEERIWIGDTGELESGEAGGDGQGRAPVILSKPDPAYAGHRATVKAKIGAGQTAKLTVFYKSGVSQAKYLGETTADGEGIVEWNWLVGGNTTPGTWTFVVETEDGLRTAMEFEVTSPK